MLQLRVKGLVLFLEDWHRGLQRSRYGGRCFPGSRTKPAAAVWGLSGVTDRETISSLAVFKGCPYYV